MRISIFILFVIALLASGCLGEDHSNIKRDKKVIEFIYKFDNEEKEYQFLENFKKWAEENSYEWTLAVNTDSRSPERGVIIYRKRINDVTSIEVCASPSSQFTGKLYMSIEIAPITKQNLCQKEINNFIRAFPVKNR